jgi:hypothetical protein
MRVPRIVGCPQIPHMRSRGLRPVATLVAAVAVIGSLLHPAADMAMASKPATAPIRAKEAVLKGSLAYDEVRAGEAARVRAVLHNGTSARRTYVLEIRKRSRWKEIDRKRSAPAVEFKVATKRPGVVAYRVSTPAARVEGKQYPRLRTKRLHLRVNGPRRPPSNWTRLFGNDGSPMRQCGIQVDGTAWCWGRSHAAFGLTGASSARRSIRPLQVPGTWKTLELSGDSTCGIRTDNTMWCWGESVGPTTQLPGSWSTMESSRARYCGIRTDTSAACWELFVGSANPGSLVELDGSWSQLSVSFGGGGNVCGVRVDGSGWCKGYNEWGQLGNGSEDGQNVMIDHPLTQVPGSWASIETQGQWTCGSRTDSSRACWGFMEGLSADTGPSPTPSEYTATVLAGNVLCGLRESGAVFCYAYDLFTGPSTATVGSNVTSMIGSEVALCFIEGADQLNCGQPGDWLDGESPVRIPGNWRAPSIVTDDAAAFAACALAADSTAWCIGDNRDGAMGVNSEVAFYDRMQQVQ